MESEQDKKYRPCWERCIAICVASIITNVIFLDILFVFKFKLGCVCIFLVNIVVCLYFIIFAIFKLNSPVYIDEEKIAQKQFGKIKTIYYSEIENIKRTGRDLRFSWLITIRKNKEKISFEDTSKVYDKFCELCTNEEIMNQLKKMFKYRDWN